MQWLSDNAVPLGAIASIAIILLFVRDVLSGAPSHVRHWWRWSVARLGWFPLRIVQTKTLRRLRTPEDLERYLPPQLPPANAPRAHPMNLKERVEKLVAETRDAMGRYDAMTAHQRHELNAYFKPYVMQFVDMSEEIRNSGHPPSFEVARLLGAEWDYWLTPSRGDVEVIVKYLSSLKWDEGKPSGGYRYTGGAAGEYYLGIPARDLTEDDYASLSEENRALVDNGKLYRRIKPDNGGG